MQVPDCAGKILSDMPTTSITAAVKTKYEALTAANFPSSTVPAIYFGTAPVVDGSGTQVRPPYTVFNEGAREVKPLDFERNNIVTIDLTMQVFANTLADVDTICNAIRFNQAIGAGVVGDGTGFDYGTLSDLTTPRSTLQIVPAGEPRRLENTLDRNGARCHGAILRWKLTVLETS